MSTQVQELINKIKSEGIEEAQKKAKEIETQAYVQSDEIIAKAKKEAEAQLMSAKAEIARTREAAEKSLKQAARDTILDLKTMIDKTLKKIIQANVNQVLNPDQLSQILTSIIDKSIVNASKGTEQNLKIFLNPTDYENLKNGFIAKLKEKIKGGFEFKSSEDISKGFTISFDGGKSSFEFSESALTDYLTMYLNPEIAALIKDSK